MKKQIIAAALAIATSGAAQADFLRLEAGAGIWNSDPDNSTVTYKVGSFNDTVSASDDLGYDTSGTTYLWLNLKHPVPVIPNVRLEYTDPTFDGNGQKTISWRGLSYGTNSYSKLALKQTDLTLYYNLLDNTFWATLDLGLDIKLVDYTYELRDLSGTVAPYKDSGTFPIPMLYARTRAQLPFTGFGVEADIKYIGNGSTQVYDARAKVDYTFDMVPVVQPAIELGYRKQKFKIDEDGEETKTDLDFSGVYAGVMLRF